MIPTLTTCGEMIRCVLGAGAGQGAGLSKDNAPWDSTLATNRQNWQKKVNMYTNMGYYVIQKKYQTFLVISIDEY